MSKEPDQNGLSLVQMSSGNTSIYLGLSDTQNVVCLQYLFLTGLNIPGPVTEPHKRELDRKKKTWTGKQEKDWVSTNLDS